MLGRRLMGLGCLMMWIILSLLSASFTPAMAQNLYQVSLPAPSDETQLPLMNAFERMLLKVTGNHQRVDQVMQLTTLPSMHELIYQQTQADGSLNVSFNQYKVNQLLRTANIDIWPTPRPRVLVWIAQQTGQGNTIIGEHQPNELVAGLYEGGQQRALPIALPLMDFDDLSAVTFTDIWGRFLQPVVQASQRYQVQYIVLVKVQYNDNNPAESQMIWQLIDNTGHPLSQGEELGLIEDSGVTLANQLADDLAERLAAAPEVAQGTSVLVDVENIKGMADVVMVKRYFEQLAGVHQVTLASVKPNGMQLSLKLLSSQQQLRQLLTEQGRVTWQEGDVKADHLAVVWQGAAPGGEAP